MKKYKTYKKISIRYNQYMSIIKIYNSYNLIIKKLKNSNIANIIRIIYNYISYIMSKTNNLQMNIEEKKQRILKMIEEYWDDEDKKIDREEVLSYDENIEKIYTLFITKEKSNRDTLLEKYQKEATEEQQKLKEEYLIQRKNLYRLVEEMKKLILKFEDMRQKNYDEEEADELLNSIE